MYKAHRGKSTGRFFKAHKPVRRRKVIAIHARRALKRQRRKLIAPAKVKATRFRLTKYRSIGGTVPAAYKRARITARRPKPKPYRAARPPRP